MNKDGSIRLKMGEIIPATNKQTTAARRTRLRNHLSTILASHGWKELRANVYHQPEKEGLWTATPMSRTSITITIVKPLRDEGCRWHVL